MKLTLSIPQMKLLDKKDASWKELSYGKDFSFVAGSNTAGFDNLADNKEDTFREISVSEYIAIMAGSNGTVPSVSGLEIHVANGSDLQALSAIGYYDNDGEEDLGQIEIEGTKSVIYVKFLKPIKAYALSLYRFIGSSNVKISEIKVYTSAK